MARLIVAITIIALAASGVLTSPAPVGAPEKDLAKYLIRTAKDIGRAGRPVQNVADPMNIQIGLTMSQLIEANKNTVTFQAIRTLTWTDPFLAWNPAQFDGASQVTIPAELIWRPDIAVWNSVSEGSADQTRNMLDADALILPDGTVYWVSNMIYQIPCEKDADGILQCTMIAGSWAYDTSKMAVAFTYGKADIDVSMMSKTPGLEIVRHSAIIDNKEFDCCPGTKYAFIKFKFGVKVTERDAYDA